MQPSVANTSHSCNFPPRCRGAHRAPADIIQTFDFPPQRPPSSREGDRPQTVEGVHASRPPTFRFLSKPFIQLRVQGRNPARFKGGYGVPRGFKGEKSKSPPNPLGLAERVNSFHRLREVPLPRGGRSGGCAGQGLRPCRRLNIGALRSPLSPFARPLETSYKTPGAGSQPCSFQRGLWGS